MEVAAAESITSHEIGRTVRINLFIAPPGIGSPIKPILRQKVKLILPESAGMPNE